MHAEGTEREAWELLAEATGALVMVTDGDDRIVYASANHATMLGYRPEDLPEVARGDWIHPEDLPRVAEAIRGLKETLSTGVLRYRAVTRDGRDIWISSQVGARRTPDGGIRLVGLSRDVTREEEAEDTLRDSQQKYRLLAEGASDVLWIMGPDLKTRYMSPAVERQLGYTVDEYLALSLEERLPPESVQKVRETFARESAVARDLARQQKPHAFKLEMLHRHKGGRLAWGEVHVSFMYDPAWNIVGLHGVTRNIDDRKQAELALERREAYYRRLFEETRHGLLVTEVVRDDAGQAVDLVPREVNPAFCAITGARPGDLIDHRSSQVAPVAVFRESLRTVPEILAGRTVQEVWRPREGLVLEVVRWSIPGDRIVTMIVDVTERLKAEEALARSERHYRRFFQEIRSGMAVCDLVRDDAGKAVDFVYREVNPAYAQHTGLALDRVVGHRASEIFGPEELARRLETLRPVMEGRLFREECFIHSLQRWFDASFWSLTADSFVIMFEDVTARRRMEEEIARSQKLESVGLLAGGIAHDFNNILTGILGNISLVRMLSRQDGGVEPLLASAEEACGRARDLTQQLLTFSRGGEPVKADVPLQDVLRQATDFVLAGSSVACTYRFAATGLVASVDRGQIAQVVQNLVLNASQAMPDGGRIEIAADRVDLSEGGVAGLKAGPYVRFSVRDRGHGIAPEHREKVFDPYFTTRPKGQGLGLPVSFSIVRKHGGAITLETEVGRGSTFTVYLPAARSRETPMPGTLAPVSPARRGRVLVMDDDPAVREVMGRMLAVLGFEAASVPDGAEAVRMYRRHLDQDARFDLVLMDLTVPGGMGGKAAVREILSLDPRARAIVMSGYSTDPVMADHAAHGFQGVLPKPVKMPDLQDVLSRVLALPD